MKTRILGAQCTENVADFLRLFRDVGNRGTPGTVFKALRCSFYLLKIR